MMTLNSEGVNLRTQQVKKNWGWCTRLPRYPLRRVTAIPTRPRGPPDQVPIGRLSTEPRSIGFYGSGNGKASL